MQTKNPFHACATCVNYEALKLERGMKYRCKRLGYETMPHYQFNCWEPHERAVKAMKSKGLWKSED